MTAPDGPVPSFADHLVRTHHLSATLGDTRCRPSGRFASRAQDTVRILMPLLAPWVPELLLVLHLHGPSRFNGIKRRLLPISSRVLTDKLRHLETHGLAARIADDTGHHYALTPHGTNSAVLLHPLLHYLRTQDTPERS